MRVQYTLPGYQPAFSPLPSADETGIPPFQSHIRPSQWQGDIDWKRVLNVDRVPSSSASIGPPPRPMSLESQAPETERMRWHHLLSRHGGTRELQATTQSSNKVSLMMFLLVQVQREADAVTARSFEGEPG